MWLEPWAQNTATVEVQADIDQKADVDEEIRVKAVHKESALVDKGRHDQYDEQGAVEPDGPLPKLLHLRVI